MSSHRVKGLTKTERWLSAYVFHFVTWPLAVAMILVWPSVPSPDWPRFWLAMLGVFFGLLYTFIAMLAGLVVAEWVDNWVVGRVNRRIAEQHLSDIYREWERGDEG